MIRGERLLWLASGLSTVMAGAGGYLVAKHTDLPRVVGLLSAGSVGVIVFVVFAVVATRLGR
jgi:hypothetical protein